MLFSRSHQIIYFCVCQACVLAISGTPATAQTAARLPGAQVKHPEQATWQTRDNEIREAPATAATLIASPPLTSADRQLTRGCLARYGLWGIPGNYEDSERETTREATAEKTAKRFFDSMSHAEIAARLVPIRKALYRGTRAYTAVSFVLAYYDIDFTQNALSVVEAIALNEPSARLRAAGLKDNEDPSGAEEVAAAVSALYHKRHSAPLLTAYLRAPTDGHIEEDRLETVAFLFLAFPADVLGASAEGRDMHELADSVADSGCDYNSHTRHTDYSKVWHIIRRLEHSRDIQTARLARRFQRVFASAAAQPPER